MTWYLEIDNVAGIRSGSATIKPQTNVIRASNWQGKSSFIRAIKTAMGTDRTLTEGESTGRVQLKTPDDTIEVDLERAGTAISRSGTPYLSDEYARTCAELFAFLDESNDIRRAVRSGESLEPILTEPLELENIDEQIAELKHERERVEREFERATDASDRIPTLQRKIEAAEEELATLRSERSDLESGEGEHEDVESLRKEVSDVRSEKAQVEDLIERTTNAIERTQETLNERYEELRSIDVSDTGDLEDEIANARDGLPELERDKELLESLYSVNSRILEEDRVRLLGDVDHGLLDDSHTCWTCGNDATREDVEERLSSIREEIERLTDEIEERSERVEHLQERRDERKQARKRKRDLEQEIQQLEDTLSDREGSLTSARERLDVLEEQLAELEAQVDESDDRLTSIESEIKYQNSKLEELREELESCRNDAEQRDSLKEERERLTEEIEGLRNRKDRIRKETRRAFDDAIAEVITAFDTSFESAHLTGNFELVVARDGREASLDALSEGELELLGIVAALAGYDAYDVAEQVPVMLLDGLGGLADENLNTLVEYLEDRTEYLVLTAYPENTSLGDWEINPDEWSVVSNQSVRAT